MNAITKRPIPMEWAFSASTDLIDEELRFYDEHLADVRGLALATRRNMV